MPLFLTGLTIGIILGFQTVKNPKRWMEMCHQCFDYFHTQAHREESG